ncbi:hypothetical protein [Nocardia wallacei]|uniref:hypothetical protein n=1 Tax=Nocardia wallacei TaxID=480035 RepID=UPI002457844A|nr:hypothetical protein [Nocardia wallacei]
MTVREVRPDSQDSLDEITKVVQQCDDSIDAHVVGQAVGRVFPAGRREDLHRLAQVLLARPALLTGSGAEAPSAAVLRLIAELGGIGAGRIVMPSCPFCHRHVRLPRRREGLWSCGTCIGKRYAVPCHRCSRTRPVTSRDADGNPLCSHCHTMDPTNHKVCGSCGRRRPCQRRDGQGRPLCNTCRNHGEHRARSTRTCSICERTMFCTISKATGLPSCRTCLQVWAACTKCGAMKQIRGGTRHAPLCATCAQPDLSRWHACPNCGEHGQLSAGPCRRCTLDRRLRSLLDDGSGSIRPELQALHHNFATTARPRTGLRWLAENSTASGLLADMASGRRPLDHATLDEPPHSQTIEQLRAILVNTGALPARDEHLIRVQRWIDEQLAARTSTTDKELLHRYAVWHLLRRHRQRIHGTTTDNQAKTIKYHVTAATVFLDWLRENNLTPTTCRQGDLERWLALPAASNRDHLGHFVRWVSRQGINPHLHMRAARWTGPAGPLDHEQRWQHIHRLLDGTGIDTSTQVAGLITLFYAQTPTAISRLTTDDILVNGDTVQLRLGTTPLTLPPPLAELVTELLATRRSTAVLGETGTSTWLFPGKRPGQPARGITISRQLNRAGIRPSTARSAALFQLATELPAVVLARALGIHPKVAAEWQRAASGDWSNYAAEIAHRGRRS